MLDVEWDPRVSQRDWSMQPCLLPSLMIQVTQRTSQEHTAHPVEQCITHTGAIFRADSEVQEPRFAHQ